ncbi:hypothetical protein ACE939_04725 [Aquimarina sp. W85]|uniref:hypothetical protein n=1 Tax=Aquimarina rhodophyticola TaxID=3342246 RepID=UPI0036715DA5
MEKETQLENKEVKSFHVDLINWKTNLQRLDNELYFLKKLLNSNAFASNIPNVYEILTNFKIQLKDIEKSALVLYEELQVHENQLGGLLECDTIYCDHFYVKRHKEVQYMYKKFCDIFAQEKNDMYLKLATILRF